MQNPEITPFLQPPSIFLYPSPSSGFYVSGGRTTPLHTGPSPVFLLPTELPTRSQAHSLSSCSRLSGKNKTQIFNSDYCANDQKFSNPSSAIRTYKTAAGFKNWELPRDLIIQNVARLYDTLLLYKHLKWCSHMRFKYMSMSGYIKFFKNKL